MVSNGTFYLIRRYRFAFGSTHPSVGALKRFLSSKFNALFGDQKQIDLFNEEFEAVIASIQKQKGLIPTGAMDLATWAAIGTEMNLHQINVASIGDQTIQNMLMLGYRLKHPPRSNNSMVNAKIRSTSEGGGIYDFTFSLYLVSFAPFDWFGPFSLSKGDGKDRRFGYDQRASYRLRCFSEVHVTPGDRTYNWVSRRATETRVSDPTTSILAIPIPINGLPVYFMKEARSPGSLIGEEFSYEFRLPPSEIIRHRSNKRLKFHFYGNDDALALWGKNSWAAADIDLHPTINFHYEPDKNNQKNITMRVYGNVVGDQFPSAECYVIDKNNNGVMIGVWQVTEGDGPVLSRNYWRSLEGDKRLPMFDFDFKVIVEDGVFKRVIRNGRTMSLTEHNAEYINLPSVKSAN